MGPAVWPPPVPRLPKALLIWAATWAPAISPLPDRPHPPLCLRFRFFQKGTLRESPLPRGVRAAPRRGHTARDPSARHMEVMKLLLKRGSRVFLPGEWSGSSRGAVAVGGRDRLDSARSSHTLPGPRTHGPTHPFDPPRAARPPAGPGSSLRPAPPSFLATAAASGFCGSPVPTLQTWKPAVRPGGRRPGRSRPAPRSQGRRCNVEPGRSIPGAAR